MQRQVILYLNKTSVWKYFLSSVIQCVKRYRDKKELGIGIESICYREVGLCLKQKSCKHRKQWLPRNANKIEVWEYLVVI